MAVINQGICVPRRTVNNAPVEIFMGKEAASQSFKKGEPVYLVSGLVAICGADPAAILGIADADASGVTGAPIPVVKANGATLFCANIYHSTPASAVTAQADVGTSYGIIVVSNKLYVDKEETVATRAQVIGLDSRDAVGDQYGRVLFKFLVANRQLI